MNTDRRRIADLEQVADAWAALRPDADPRDFEIMLYIDHITRLLNNLYRKIAARHDLNAPDVRLLMALARDQGAAPVRATDLGYRVMLTPAAVTYRLDRLVEAKLVSRKEDASDRRAYHIKLTAKGQRLTNDIVSEIGRVRTRNLAVFDRIAGSKAKLAEWLRLLAREWERPD